MIQKCIDDQAKDNNRGNDAVFNPFNPSEEVMWKDENIIFPFLPKKHIKSFSKSKVFMSKQVPLLIISEVKN